MNKKLLALLASGLAALALNAQAQTAPAPATPPAPPTPTATPAVPEAPSLSVTFTPSVVSQYMFRGQRLGGPSLQPSVEADYGNFAIGIWSNVPLKDRVAGVSDPEIDPYGSYTISVNDSLSVVPGFTYYTYPNAPTDQGFYKGTFEPSLAVNYTIAGLKLTPKIYYDFVLDAPTLELTGTYAVPLKDLGTELDFTAQGGDYIQRDAADNANPPVKAWGRYWLLGVAAPFQVNKSSTVTLGWAFTRGEDAFIKQGTFGKVPNTSAVGRGVVTISYAIKW